MERLIIVLISILLLILDNSLVPFFAIKGAYPSLLFTFVIAYSLVNKKENAVFIGVVSGILQDIFFYHGFGINALLNLILCLSASVIGEGIVRNKRLIPVISMFFVTILKYIGIFIILYIYNIKIHFTNSICMGLYNSVIMFFIYKYIMNIYDDEYTKQRWRFR